jgi:hypothetical protein
MRLQKHAEILHSPTDIIQRDNGPLKIRIRIAHGIQEALSDNDAAKNTLIISCREDHIRSWFRGHKIDEDLRTKESHRCGTSNGHPDIEFRPRQAKIRLPSIRGHPSIRAIFFTFHFRVSHESCGEQSGAGIGHSQRVQPHHIRASYKHPTHPSLGKVLPHSIAGCM